MAEPRQVVERLGEAREDRPDAQVAGPFEDGLLDLLAVVRRAADEGAGPDDPPGVPGRHVLLAEVDRVGPGQPREIGPVVHYESRPGPGRQDPDLAGPREPFAVGQPLLAELDRP